MGDGALLNIQVSVFDRPYRLKVQPEEEENVRKAARILAEKLKELQQQYNGNDKQDFLAMSALTLIVEHLEKENKSGSNTADTESLVKTLEHLDQQIIQALES